MRSNNLGQIDEGLWLLGTKESCVYLLEGSQSSALISAGMSYILPDLLRQINDFGISAGKIEHIIILHSHFDHVGIVPFLKRKWPRVKIYASARAWQVLSNPKAVSLINEYALKVCRRVRGSTDALFLLDWQWRFDVHGEELGEGSRIDLGNRHIEIHETPGHSSCSISACVPQLKALFPSDAVAIPYRDEYVIAAGSSFRQYEQSLDKLSGLNIEILCADHYGYVRGEEAKHYITKSREATQQMIDRLLLALREEGSADLAAGKLVKHHFDQRPDYFVDPDILLGTYTHMLKQFIDTGAHSS